MFMRFMHVVHVWVLHLLLLPNNSPLSVQTKFCFPFIGRCTCGLFMLFGYCEWYIKGICAQAFVGLLAE